MGLFMARAPKRCKGVMREATVEGAVEAVDTSLKTEEGASDKAEAGVTEEFEE